VVERGVAADDGPLDDALDDGKDAAGTRDAPRRPDDTIFP
jgi:hypothetical protein